MIILIGANSALSKNIIPYFPNESIYAVGRTPPGYLIQNSNVKFIQTDYIKVCEIIEKLSDIQNCTVIFAGIDSSPSLLIDLSENEINRQLRLNLEFSVNLVSKILPKMISDKFGRFIFIGSTFSSLGVPGGSLYEIIKSGQKGLSRSIAVEYARFGITSNVLELGLLPLGYSENFSEKKLEDLRYRIPTRKPLEYKQIANVMNSLILNSNISGSIVTMDSGIN